MSARGIVVALLLLLVAACSSAPPPAGPAVDEAGADALAGDWSGTVELPGSPLEVGVRFTAEGGTLDVPAQGLRAVPLADVRVDGTAVSFRVPGVPGDASYAGTLAGDRVTGEFRQAGRAVPLVLRRGALAAPARPQEPREPFPYRVEEVRYRNGDVELAGTLTLPEGPGPFAAALLISGSGAQDRDSTLAGHEPFLLLADTLTRAGHAVLRVDDRGVGGSGGSYSDADYAALAADVLAGVSFLRGRPEVDPARVGLVGHSEGGYLAPLAAQRAPGDVAFVVLLAGPAVSGEEVLVEQNRLLLGASGAPPAEVEAQTVFIREFVARLGAGDLEGARALARERVRQATAALPEDQRPSAEQIEAQLAVTPALRAFVTYDPAPALEALRVPLLAVYGGKDLQVPASQSEPALRERTAADPDVTIRTFPELNHLLQPATTGLPAEYGQIGTTVDPQVLDLLTSWMAARS